MNVERMTLKLMSCDAVTRFTNLYSTTAAFSEAYKDESRARPSTTSTQ